MNLIVSEVQTGVATEILDLSSAKSPIHKRIRNMIDSMIQIDPEKRMSCEEYLSQRVFEDFTRQTTTEDSSDFELRYGNYQGNEDRSNLKTLINKMNKFLE